MEVNDYLPSRIRVLSSENPGKLEPDFVTTPFDAGLDLTPAERDRVLRLKDENRLDELFRMLFIKQCNKLHELLPELFEATSDYTELLLTLSFTDKDGVVYPNTSALTVSCLRHALPVHTSTMAAKNMTSPLAKIFGELCHRNWPISHTLFPQYFSLINSPAGCCGNTKSGKELRGEKAMSLSVSTSLAPCVPTIRMPGQKPSPACL